MLPLVVLGVVALARSIERSNEEDEEELELMRERNQRLLRGRRSRLEKLRRKKEIKLELVAREKELKLVEQAEKLAVRQFECGNRELNQFNKELALFNEHSIKLPVVAVEALQKQLGDKTKDLKSVVRRCRRHIKDVRGRIQELNDKRFYFRCVSCRTKFVVHYGDLEAFEKSRKGVRKCCDKCLPRLRALAEKRAAKRNACTDRGIWGL